MLYAEIARILSRYLCFLACTLCVPLAVAVYFQFGVPASAHPQPHTTGAFLGSIATCLLLAGGFFLWGRKGKGVLYRRESLLLVVVIWFISAFVGALPFYYSQTLSHPLDAYFEAMSGLTTTGATVMQAKEYSPLTGEELPIERVISLFHETEYRYYGTLSPVRDPVTGEEWLRGVEGVSRALLFWRSFMQWLGGMGIVVLFVAVLPALGVGGKMLYQAEVPGPTKDAVTPRVKETASWLWRVYMGLTLLEVVLLKAAEIQLPWFDAICLTFSNLSTGGFSVRNEGIAAYHSGALEWVVILFMLVGSTNFSLYFHCLRGRFFRLFEVEFLLYYASVILGALLVTWYVVGETAFFLNGEERVLGWWEGWRQGCFHLISAQTSTGFSTVNYDAWPFVVQVVLFIVMFVGSMSGSTGGGIKIIRHYMVFKIISHRIVRIFRPDTVRVFRVGQWEMDSNVAQTVLSFYLIVITLCVGGTLLLTMDGVDPETALGLNGCMVNNIGMAFRMAGPTESFAFLSPFGKVLSMIWMVLGRLEFFAVLVVLIPDFWKAR